MERPSRRAVLGLVAGASASLAGCVAGSPGGQSGSGGDDGTAGPGDATDGAGARPTWQTATLTDVRSGETFSVADFDDRPVLLETFAVWCSTCLQQQKELQTFHERVGDDVVSITLDVDPNEDAAKVRSHLERHGFDWRYAISPSPVTRSLVEQFGESITVPPRAPVVLVCPGGSARRLPDGVKTASDLQSAVDEGC